MAADRADEENLEAMGFEKGEWAEILISPMEFVTSLQDSRELSCCLRGALAPRALWAYFFFQNAP